jgi:hypothetical protein
MAAKSVCVDHDTPVWMPTDLREWVPGDHLVYFVPEAVGLIEWSAAAVAAVEEREQRADPSAPGPEASTKERMEHRLEKKEGRELFALRKQTSGPILGIVRETLGFRRFRPRGLKNARTECTLVALACKLMQLFFMGMELVAD